MRTKVFLRGVVTADANGDAFVAFDPMSAIANDVMSVTFSDGTAAVGNAVEPDTTVVGVSGQMSNSLFGKLSFDPAVHGATHASYRTVAWGLRWRTTAPEIDISGSHTGITSGGDVETLDLLTFGECMEFQECEPISISSSRKWLRTLGSGAMSGGKPDTPGFYKDVSGINGTVTLGGKPLNALIASGAPSGTWEYEAVAHYEIDGAMAGKLPSHSDPVGRAAIDALTAPPHMRAAREESDNANTSRKFISEVCDYVTEGISGLISWAAPHVKTAAKDATLAALSLLLL